MAYYVEANKRYADDGRSIISYGPTIEGGGGYNEYFKSSWYDRVAPAKILCNPYTLSYTVNGLTWKGIRIYSTWYTNDVGVSSDYNIPSSVGISWLYNPYGIRIWLNGLDGTNSANSFLPSRMLDVYDAIDYISTTPGRPACQVHEKSNSGTDIIFINYNDFKALTKEQIAAKYDRCQFWLMNAKNVTEAEYNAKITEMKVLDKHLFESVLNLSHPCANVLQMVQNITNGIGTLVSPSTKTYKNSTWSTSKTWYIKVTFSKKTSSSTSSTSNVVNYVTMIQKYILLLYINLLKSL